MPGIVFYSGNKPCIRQHFQVKIGALQNTLRFKQFVLDITSLGYEHASEFYIAPMYNYLITNAKDVRYSVVNETDVIFCGIPEEYEAFCASV